MSQTILVVDDSQTIRKVVDMALKVAPLGVLEAETAAEALQKADEDPRVVLLDYHLPDASGYEVCEKLKSKVDAPVIMLAGQRHGFDQQKAKQAGVDDVVPKPFDTDALLDAIVGATGLEKRDMVKRLGDAGPDTGEQTAEAASSGSQASQPGGSQSGARRPSPESSSSKPRFQPAARDEESGARSGSSAQSKPRMRRPDQDDNQQQQSGSSAGGSGGSKPRFQPGSRSGSQAGSQSGSQQSGAQRGSGASSPGGSGARQQAGAGGPDDAGGEQEGPDIDIDLDSPADHKAEPDQAPGGSGSKPVTTPESQAGGGSTPADVGGGSGPQTGGSAPGGGGAAAGQAATGETADSEEISEDIMESEEFKSLIREQVKETVREQLPKLMRKLMGDIFQKKVLPKLMDHTDERIDKLFDEKLAGEVQQVVRREIDRMLQEE